MSRRRGRDDDWQSRRGGWAERQDAWTRHLSAEMHRRQGTEDPPADRPTDDEPHEVPDSHL